MTIRDTIEDMAKTLFPPGVVMATIQADALKAGLEIALLVLSIAYTVIRLAMLVRHRGREREIDTGEADPPDFLDPQ